MKTCALGLKNGPCASRVRACVLLGKGGGSWIRLLNCICYTLPTEGDGVLKLEDGGIFAIPKKLGGSGGKEEKSEEKEDGGTASRRRAKEPTLAQRRRGDLCRIGGAAAKE